MSIGVPEIIILFVVSSVTLIPLAAGVWGIVMLLRLRATQEEMRRRLDGLEQALRRAPTVTS